MKSDAMSTPFREEGDSALTEALWLPVSGAWNNDMKASEDNAESLFPKMRHQDE